VAIGWLTLFPEEFEALGKHTAGGAGFISNILYWRESGYFDAEAATKPLLHLWSLGIEEQFYIVFPFLLFGAWKSGIRIGLFIALLLTVSLAYNLHLAHEDTVADFYSPLARFWELLAGAFLAACTRVAVTSRLRRVTLKIDGLLARLISKNCENSLAHLLSALGIIIVGLTIFTFKERPTWPGHWAVIPVAGAFMILVAGQKGFFNRYLLSRRPAVAIGLISYPLYLWHWPILSYTRILSGGPPDCDIRILGAIIALVLAGLTYKLVERPFRFGLRFRTLKTAALAAALATAAWGGVYVYTRAGLPERGVHASHYGMTPAFDGAWQTYTGMRYNEQGVDFFGRFSGGHGSSTVALIGNSHAWSAYFGVEKLNTSRGVNTLLLATGGPPLLFGRETMEDNSELKERYREILLRCFEVLERPEIKYVFIIISRQRAMEALYNHVDLQPTVDRLTAVGKKVFLVENWPHLPRRGVDYTPRPFFGTLFKSRAAANHRRELDRNILFNDGKNTGVEYVQLLRSVKNVTLIDNTWDAFCPGSECRVFSETGDLLYSDETHLTNAGSKLLTEKVLAPYLMELAR
jgi:peptidoglycan/LPS O-acetylase OafA/YrhL